MSGAPSSRAAFEQRRANEFVGHHSEELLLLGVLGFDSAGFAAAGFESDAFESDDDDLDSDGFADSLGFESLEDFASLDDFESVLAPLSEGDADEPSPFDVERRDAF